VSANLRQLDLNQVISTSLNVIRLRRPWQKVVGELECEREQIAIAPFPHGVFKWPILATGELAGFFADMEGVQCTSTRRSYTLLSAAIHTIVSGADEYVDKVLRSTSDRRLVIESLWKVLRTGQIALSDTPEEIRSLYPFCGYVHETIQRSPNPNLFWSECELLVEAALDQATGDGSVDVIKRIGAHAVGVSAVLSGCFGFRVSDRVLGAARAFGSHLNLLDALRDVEEDILQGIATPLTCSINLAADIAFVSYSASECWQLCEDALRNSERRRLRSIGAMTNLILRFEGEKYSWRAYQSLTTAQSKRW
jgi:hypothetical protein